MTGILIILLVLLLGVTAVLLTDLVSSFFKAPFVGSSQKRIATMIALARLTKSDRVVDLGSGDGRVLQAVAPYVQKAVGYELNPLLVWWSRARLRRYPNVTIVQKNIFSASVHDATVVFLYLSPSILGELKKKFTREFPHGSRIISNGFPIPGWKPTDHSQGVYQYKIGKRL